MGGDGGRREWERSDTLNVCLAVLWHQHDYSLNDWLASDLYIWRESALVWQGKLHTTLVLIYLKFSETAGDTLEPCWFL